MDSGDARIGCDSTWGAITLAEVARFSRIIGDETASVSTWRASSAQRICAWWLRVWTDRLLSEQELAEACALLDEELEMELSEWVRL